MGHHQLIGYARASASDPDAAAQREALTAAGCARVVVETASGARAGRPELAKALDRMRPGDALVVWRLDRLARTLAQLVETVTDLQARGVGLRSLRETIDTAAPEGPPALHVFAALAEFEREAVRERARAGLDGARARGKVGGRPRKLSDADLAVARSLLHADPPVPYAEVARRLKVRPGTLYNHFPVAKRTSSGHGDAAPGPAGLPAASAA